MRIYTRTGDRGETGLVGGGRIAKTSSRIDALGAVDELNAVLGMGRVQAAGDHVEVERLLFRTQNQLFDLGSEIATPLESEYFSPAVGPEEIAQFESEMDQWTQSLEPLKNFILPGGTALAATLHLARTVCRRAEREALRCRESDPIRDEVLIYLNRLSDWLFVMARWVNAQSGVADVKWVGRGERK